MVLSFFFFFLECLPVNRLISDVRVPAPVIPCNAYCLLAMIPGLRQLLNIYQNPRNMFVL